MHRFVLFIVCCKTKMEATPIVKSKRERNQNFNQVEIEYIADKFLEHRDILTSTFSNSLPNDKKNRTWEEITAGVNSLGYAVRTSSQVRDKWKNIRQKSKQMYSKAQQSMNRTGGGPADQSCDSSPTTQKVISAQLNPCFSNLLTTPLEDVAHSSDLVTTPLCCEDVTNILPPETVSVPSSLPVATTTGADLNPCVPIISSARVANKEESHRAKRRITQQDIWQLQYDVLRLEKKKLKPDILKLKSDNRLFLSDSSNED